MPEAPVVDSPADSTPIRVVLKERRAQPFFGRHPWVFEGAIDAVESDAGEEPAAGAIVELWSAKNEFVAHGLWNPQSNIRVRLYSWDQHQPLNNELLHQKVKTAVELRRSMFDLTSDKTACRMIFSEADGLSGLAVDFYGRYLLVQFTSLALFKYRNAIVDALQQEVQPLGIWLRTEKGMRETEGLEIVDGLISGQAPPRPMFMNDHGVEYGVDVQEGPKTGCYLDQRDNRIFAAKYVKGCHVLDAFCFSGGFGITAAVKGGATRVLGVDSSEPALVLAAANAELNGVADRCSFRRGDVRAELESMAEQGTKFDVVVLDPPRMARTRGGLGRALNGYSRLNELGVDVLKPGGILVTCSCSGLVSRADFLEMIAGVARVTGRDIQILEQHGQPADHPVSATCPETEYLKMLICRVL